MNKSSAKGAVINKRYIRLLTGLAALLLLLSVGSVLLLGRNVSLVFHINDPESVSVGYDSRVAECVSQRISGDTLTLDFHSVSKGYTLVEVSEDGGMTAEARGLYVHSSRIITVDSIFGQCRGDIMFPVSFILLLTLVLLVLFRSYRESTRISLCRYSNAWLLGVIIFVLFTLAFQLLSLVKLNMSGGNQSVIALFESTLYSAQLFTTLLMPIAVIISLAISISNLILMKREGVCLGNMLGFFLGILLCAGSVAPHVVYPLFDSLGIEVHRSSSLSLLLERCVEDVIAITMAYLECILLGTSISAVRAARHIPKFDKDYILVLGCQITKDGGLTKLLQSRTDRAVKFAEMQKKQTGRDIVFVPSGGKGSDEVIAEGRAIGNYLASIGIPEERILVEDKSVNTNQNIRFSHALISERKSDAKIAFSTTNYHVFRAGCIADELGIPMEGIGAGTKSYFWINAFIREFIAALHYDKRNHIQSFILILVCVLPLEVITYLSSI